MALPAGPEYGAKYTLTGPDGTVAVFNDSASPNFVGILSPESSGLDSADVRESAVDAVEEDGGVHGNFYYGRRPVVLQGTIIATSAEDRNKKAAKIQGASNAMRGDATLKWTPVGGEELELKLRRQQPVRFTKGFVKEFQIPLVSSDAEIFSAVATTASATVLATSSTKLAGEGVNLEPGSTNWENLTRITANDGSYAQAALTAKGDSKYLQAKKFGFAIPTTAIITKIKASMRKNATEEPIIKDKFVQLIKAGVIQAENKAVGTSWPVGVGGEVSNYEFTPGSYTAADINNSNFGFGVSITHLIGESTTVKGGIDYMQIEVGFTEYPTIEFNNQGTAESFPVVKITGPITNPGIRNTQTGEQVFLNYKLLAGHTLTIDYNNRTVLDNEVNVYSAINFLNTAWNGFKPGKGKLELWTGTEITVGVTKLEVEYRSAWA